MLPVKFLKSRLYVLLGWVLLLVVAVYTGFLHTDVQMHNADQLVDSMLFASGTPINEILWPGSHTFFIKWPLFALTGALGVDSLFWVTILVYIFTLVALAWLFTRVASTNFAKGSVLLVFTSILVYIPAQTSVGSLNPMSMCQLTTRNVEYILFILALFLCSKNVRFRSWDTILVIAVTGFLVFTDRLFAPLLIGAVLVLELIRLFNHRRVSQVILAVLPALIGSALTISGVVLVNTLGIMYLPVDGGNEITNFSLSLDFEHVFNAIQGLFVGVLANFGSSNPLNVIVLLLGLFCYITLVKATIKDCKNKIPVPHSLELCHQLFGASISAVFVYLISNHNYATDARYLTICMIWVLVSIAIALSSISSSGGKFMAYLEHWNTYIKALTVFGAVCCVVGVLFGFFWQYTSYLEQKAPFTEKAERNAIIDDILSQEDVPQVLVGDYWRVADVASRNKDVVPIMVNNCSGARRGTLSTISWRNWDIDKSSFTLLLTLDDSLAGFPRCTKEDAYIKYGFPTQELLVAGTEENPNELLLVYDRDAPALPEKNTVESPFSKDIFDKNGNDCKRNLMVVMAHEDDDLIFMNPAIQHRRDEGYCIQNIYLTAGDNAKGEEYVEDRQQGEIAAHETMFDVQFDVDEIQELNQKQIRAVKTKDNHYGLYFLRLPDGGMNGEGMETHDFESLAKLERGEIDEIHDIDGNTAWTRDEIVDFIGGFAQATLSELVYSQAPRNEAGQNSIMWALIDKSVSKSHDHPDHISVGKFTRTAFLKYALANSTVKFWIGYPVQDMKPNVFGHDLKRKASIFFDYAVFDEETRCTNTSNCEKTDYEKRLDRQYEWTP